MTKRTSTADTSTIGGTFPGDIESEDGGGGSEKTDNILNNILEDGQAVQFHEESKYHVPLVIPSTDDGWTASCAIPPGTSLDIADEGDIVLVGGEEHEAAVYSPSDNEVSYIDFENADSMSDGDSIAYSDPDSGFIVLSEDSGVRGLYVDDSSDAVVKDSDVPEPPSSDDFPRIYGSGPLPCSLAFDEGEPSFTVLTYNGDGWHEFEITDEIVEIRDDQDSYSDPADWWALLDQDSGDITITGVGGDEDKIVTFELDDNGIVEDYSVYEISEEGTSASLASCSFGFYPPYMYLGEAQDSLILRYDMEEESHEVVGDRGDSHAINMEFSPISVREGLIYQIIKDENEYGVEIISNSELIEGMPDNTDGDEPV